MHLSDINSKVTLKLDNEKEYLQIKRTEFFYFLSTNKGITRTNDTG